MSSVPVRTSLEVRTSASAPLKVRAVEQIRRMRGGCQSHLMRCSDGHYYVVKFQNNPQHRRVLANELLATRLAARLGLPITPGVVVEVSESLIEVSTDLIMELPRKRVPCASGLQFGSRYFGNPRSGTTLDLLPKSALWAVDNFRDFAGMLVFDKWTCNTDGRQLVFRKSGNESHYSMAMIDHGFCFNYCEWNFPDSPLRGLYLDKSVYAAIRSLNDFEPWLSRLESELTPDVICDIANDIPPEWYGHDTDALQGLLQRLNRRRSTIREGLETGCRNLPGVFPNWAGEKARAASF